MTSLPEKASLEWLRKQAKHRLEALRERDPGAQLAAAQLEVAREYGFPSWRALKAHVDALTIDGQLIEAARSGDVDSLGTLLDAHPEKLHLKQPPYEWSLLHIAAHQGKLDAVDLLLRRGLDVNVRERGDNTYPLHWAAAAGHLDVVRRLIDGGADVIGTGDDHELEVIGWATCWDGAQDATHRAVADYLVSRGARHHIFSAIALDDADDVRRLVRADASVLNRRMSRNENHQTPLHFAVRMQKPTMAALLIELGADPLAVDGSGYTAAMYAMTPDGDRAVMERIRRLTAAELRSADRGHRAMHASTLDLMAALALRDWGVAERVVKENPELVSRDGAAGGVLHLAAKRGDVEAVKWLIAHGAPPNALWPHWDAEVTPLHLVAFGGHVEVAKLLLAAGADPTIRDTKHDADAIGWAEFFGKPDLAAVLKQ